MRKATDTILRHLALLQEIPVYPRMSSATEIRENLRDINKDYDVNIRSIQRDLEKLSMLFPITCELRGRTNHWFWLNEHAITQIPAMNEYTALAFKLAGEYLRPIMPPSVLRLLNPYLNHATNILQQTKHGKWTEKTRIIGYAPELIAPTVNPKVQDIVYESLLEDRQFEVDYKARGQAEEKRRVLNPLGIVLKNGIIYLVATSWDYKDPAALCVASNAARQVIGGALKPDCRFRSGASYR